MSQISSTSLRVGFAGTPDFAALILRQLLASAFNVVVVYTQPDRPAGRRRTLSQNAVKTVALEHHLELRQPQTWKHADTINELASFDLDVLAVAAYGLILPARALSVPRHGCINVHASVLPRWRGAAPIERAIMAGDEMSGVSIMQMDEGLDTGPVFTSVTHPIGSETTGAELEGALADLGGNALLTTLMSLPALDPAPQSAVGSCYA
ncbi:MAG: methionyl-tRNA formyltransferase, partial [Gammaproteobacteria bacterium]|nr:methionyl-tRNA formyltransferase [Gammaproteobacteria bacterium]